jgi:hypothetical protein
MSLSNPVAVYGVHSVSPYRRTNGLFYGTLKVLDSSTISLNGEQNELRGGSNRHAWASEDGPITSEMNLKVGQMEDFMDELFLGKAPTVNTAEASGNVSTLTNKDGSSLVAATGLLGTITVSTAANLKFGKYVIVATGSTGFDIYMSSDIDHTRGTDTEFSTDTLKVASVAGVSTGAGSAVSALGITFTGGASATAFVTGDTATFEVRPINTGSSTVRIGGASDTFPEFGCIIMAQARSDGELFEIDAFRCKASGMPLGFEAFAWSKPELKAKLLYDSAKNGLFDRRRVKFV